MIFTKINYIIEFDDGAPSEKRTKTLELPFTPNKDINTDFYRAQNINNIYYSSNVLNIDIKGYCDEYNEIHFPADVHRFSKFFTKLTEWGFESNE